MIVAIGRIVKENSLIGIRIFDTDTKKTKDIKIEDKDKLQIINLKSLNKLGVIDNKKETKPIIILGEKENKYATVDINGKYKVLNSLEGYEAVELLTNIEQYERYQTKQNLTGNIFEFEIKEETDEVLISKYIENKEEFRTIEIPTFVTGIKVDLGNEGYIVNSPFTDIKQNLKVIYKGNKIKSMEGMFYGYKGSELDLSNFDTSKVIDMSNMFDMCENFEKIDLSKFDTSQVKDMSEMFYICVNLKELDLSNFDTSKVTGMGCMFCYCKSLKELDISNFDTSKVTDMCYMFEECKKLEKLDLSNFDTSQVTNMCGMFDDTSLTPENTGLKIKE